MRTLILRLCIAIVVIISSVPVNAATWYVRKAGGGDATTIQAGIDLASSGDVVVVGAGTYSGFGNSNIYFYGKGITLMSEAGPQSTVIDCQFNQAFQFTGGESFDAVVEGFTIKNGNGMNGGAIYCDGASPTIRYNVFCDNLAWSGGGAIYVRNGSPTIYNNTFDKNGATSGGSIMLGPDSNAQIYQNIMCGTTGGGALACSSAGSSTFVYCNDLYANAGGSTVCAGFGGQNFSMDPLFCGIVGSGNFFLQQTSPCTSSYSPCGAAVGALGIQCSVTATENVTWGAVKSLYR